MSVRRPGPLLLALVLGLVAAFAVACGDEGGDDRRLLRASDADAIKIELDKIEQRVDQGDCEALAPAFLRLDRTIEELPQRVDDRLRERLAEGAEHLEQRADEECEPETTETTPETTETLPPETTETLPPETTETLPPETTPTVPPETTPTPPEPEEPVPPDDTGGNQAPGAFLPPGQAKKGSKE